MRTPFGAVRKFWLVAILVTLVILAAASGGAFTMWTIRRDWRDVARSQHFLREFDRQRREITAAQRSLKELEAERSDVVAFFANPTDPLPFIERAEELGRRSGVEVELSFVSSGGGTQTEEFRVSAKGPFRNVFGFFRHLESFPSPLTLGSAEFTRVGVTEEKKGGPKSSSIIHLVATVRIAAP